MNVFGVGVPELLVILVIAMLVVGPERTVKLARDAGRMLAKFRQITDSVTKEFRETFSLEEDEEEESSPAVALGTDAAHTVVDANAKVVSAFVPALEAGLPDGPAEPAVSQAAQLESELASELVDGEIEVRPSAEAEVAGTPDSLAGASTEAVVVEVAQLMPEDAEAEPVDIGQAVLVADQDMAADATKGEGQIS